jgi:hypothetical protein
VSFFSRVWFSGQIHMATGSSSKARPSTRDWSRTSPVCGRYIDHGHRVSLAQRLLTYGSLARIEMRQY